MDKDVLTTNINTLKEMILDEEKLVTYVSFSKDVCIHVNQSKFVLEKAIKDIRKIRPETELNVNFLISGLSENNRARTTVCSEKDIHAYRKSFQTVFFEHIYSVSKGIPSTDNVAFLAVNKLEDFPLCIGLIKNNSCSKRSLDEIGNLKSKSQTIIQVEQKPSMPIQKKLKEEKSVSQNSNNDAQTVSKIQETKSEPIIKTEVTSPKKDPIRQKSVNNKNCNRHQKGISGFFSKSNSLPAKTTNIQNNIVTVKEETNATKQVEDMDVDAEVKQKRVENGNKKANRMEKVIKEVNTEVKKENVNLENGIKTDSNKEDSNEKSKNKLLTNITKNAKVDKKRKRVLHIPDSESDEDKDPFADEPDVKQESDDEIPPTPDVNTVKITSGIVNPRKKRKIVDKVFTDEEGYILTKKVEVYESCSENEEEASVKENVQQTVPKKNYVKPDITPTEKKVAKNVKKKLSPTQEGKKQMTMTSFFSKK